MFEIGTKSGFLSNPRKGFMSFLNILITYKKQYNRTILRRRKPIRRKPIISCSLPRVKSWLYPNKVRSLLNFSVYNSVFFFKFWTCLDNAIDNILSNF